MHVRQNALSICDSMRPFGHSDAREKVTAITGLSSASRPHEDGILALEVGRYVRHQSV